jgi:DNA (cytosine-5)-methyltransferase 1
MEIENRSIQEFRIVDLCSGTGGFSLAFHMTGTELMSTDDILRSSIVRHRFKTIYANDMEQFSKKIFEENFPDIPFVCQDLLNIDISSIPSMDIILAGFSCQPFSIAGKRKGFEDDRSDVFWQILKIMDHHKPKIVVLENVKNLISHDSGQSFEKIKSAIAEVGYQIKYKVLNTYKVSGIPQNRERVFIVCFLNSSDFELFEFPTSDNPLLDFHTLLENTQVADKYYYKPKLKIYNKVIENVTNENVIYQYRRHYFRTYDKGICPTLTANMGSGGHNVPLIKDSQGVRKLTPRECFRFQGFPDTFILPSGLKDSELYKLSGNAISVPVVQKIAEKLLSILNR